MRISTPILVVNFKSYLEATGKRAIQVAKTAERISKELGVEIAVAPQYVDIPRVVEACSLPVYAQHVDPIEPGPYTGHVLSSAIAAAGAVGSILNHSEKRMKISEIEDAVRLCRSTGMISLVCSSTANISGAVSMLGPDIIAVEPPELIGSGVAVSKARPQVITSTVERIQRANSKITVLCGAGITNGEDVRLALKLGTRGVLVSSSVIKSNNPEKVMKSFAEALLQAS